MENEILNKIYHVIDNRINNIQFNQLNTSFNNEEINKICKDYIETYSDAKMCEFIVTYVSQKVNEDNDNYDDYASIKKFAKCIDDAINEYGIPFDVTFKKILQMGKHKAYSEVLFINIKEMGLYCACKNLKEYIHLNEDLIKESYLNYKDIDKLMVDVNRKIDNYAINYSSEKLNMNDLPIDFIEFLKDNLNTLSMDHLDNNTNINHDKQQKKTINFVGNVMNDVNNDCNSVNFVILGTKNDSSQRNVYICSAEGNKVDVTKKFKKGDFVKVFGEVIDEFNDGVNSRINIKVLYSKLLKSREQMRDNFKNKDSILQKIDDNKLTIQNNDVFINTKKEICL